MLKRIASFIIFKCDKCGFEEVGKLTRGGLQIINNVEIGKIEEQENKAKKQEKRQEKKVEEIKEKDIIDELLGF